MSEVVRHGAGVVNVVCGWRGECGFVYSKHALKYNWVSIRALELEFFTGLLDLLISWVIRVLRFICAHSELSHVSHSAT